MTKFNPNHIVLAIISVFILLISCSKEKSPNNNNQQKPASEVVIIMKKDIISNTLISCDENGVLTFENLKNKDIPSVGNIICSEPTENMPFGFLYRVKEVKKVNGNVVIITEEASIEEAVDNGTLSEKIDLTDKVSGVFDPDGDPLEYTVIQPAKAGIERGINIKIDKKFKDLLGGLDLSIFGEITINQSFDLNVIITDHTISKFQFKENSNGEFDLGIRAEIEAMANINELTVQIAIIKFPPLKFFIGVIPVSITPEVPIYLKVGVKGEVKAEFKILEAKINSEFGFNFDGDKFSNISKGIDPLLSFKKPNIELSGSIKVGAKTGLSLFLYNSKFFNIRSLAELYAQFEVDEINLNDIENLNPLIKSNLGFNCDIAGKLKIWGIKDLRYETEFNVFKLKLFEKSIFLQFDKPVINNLEWNSVDISSTVKTQNIQYFLFNVTDHGFCWNDKGALKPTINDAKISFGTFTYPMIGIPEIKTTITGLQSSKEYNIRPYFTNLLGTFYGENFKFTTPEQVKNNIVFKDPVFKENLIKWNKADIDGDGEISKEEALKVNKIEMMGGYKVTYTDGLEYFTNLDTLAICYNLISEINLKPLTKLKILNLGGNKLTSLDVSMLKDLEFLACQSNLIENLDLSNNNKLDTVSCFDNKKLETLNVTGLTKLTYLDVMTSIKLSKLDCSTNSNLVELYVPNCNLNILNLKGCKELQILYCENNKILELNLSQSTKLKKIWCCQNRMETLDLQNCRELELLVCGKEPLKNVIVYKKSSNFNYYGWNADNQFYPVVTYLTQ